MCRASSRDEPHASSSAPRTRTSSPRKNRRSPDAGPLPQGSSRSFASARSTGSRAGPRSRADISKRSPSATDRPGRGGSRPSWKRSRASSAPSDRAAVDLGGGLLETAEAVEAPGDRVVARSSRAARRPRPGRARGPSPSRRLVELEPEELAVEGRGLDVAELLDEADGVVRLRRRPGRPASVSRSPSKRQRLRLRCDARSRDAGPRSRASNRRRRRRSAPGRRARRGRHRGRPSASV